MKEFEVTISERLERVVTVQAETRADAEEMVSDAWNKEEYVLTADDFQGAEFTADEGRELTPPTISVLLVQPEKYPQRVEMPNTLEALQKAVGGMIEAVYPYEDKIALIGNDEGKLNGMPLNRALRDDKGEIYDVMAGDFLVVGLGEGDFASLSPDLMDKYEAVFHQPQMFVLLGDTMLVRNIPDRMMQEKAAAPQAEAPEPERD